MLGKISDDSDLPSSFSTYINNDNSAFQLLHMLDKMASDSTVFR